MKRRSVPTSGAVEELPKENPFEAALRIGRAQHFGLNRYDELLAPSRLAAAALANTPEAVERLTEIPHAAAACELAVQWLRNADEAQARRIEDALIRLPTVRDAERILQCRALFQVSERLGRVALPALRLAARALRWNWLAHGLEHAHALAPNTLRALLADAVGRAVVDALALRNGVLQRELPLALGRAASKLELTPDIAVLLDWVDTQMLRPWLQARSALDDALLLLLPEDAATHRLHLPVPGTAGYSLRALDPVELDRLDDVRTAEALPKALIGVLPGPDAAREKFRLARARVPEALARHGEAIREARPEGPPPLESEIVPSNGRVRRRGQEPWELSDAAAARALADALESPEAGWSLFDRWARVGAVEIENGGGVFSTFADCLLTAARAFPCTLPTAEVPPWPPTRAPLALDEHPVEVLGRTLLFERDDGFRAVKLQRAGEPLDALLREAAWLASLTLDSVLPTPLTVQPVARLSAAAAERVERSGVRLAAAPWCLSYEHPERDYWSYVDALPPESRARGCERAAADLFCLLRRGIVHTALTVKNHSTGVEGDRRYEWMIDALAIPSDRFGMGRLDGVLRVCRYPNVRASGLADLAELAPLHSLPDYAPERAHTFASPRLDPVAHLHWQPAPVRDTLRWMRFAGDYLFDLTLLIASARAHRGDEEGFASELSRTWSAGFIAWTAWEPSRAREWLEGVLDFAAIAKECGHAVANLGERDDIGPHNGPLGLVTLERALHVFVTSAAAAAGVSRTIS